MFTDTKSFKATQTLMISALRERVEHPLAREFSYEDLVWIDHNTCRKYKYKASQLAIITWDRLDNFIAGGKGHHPCRFTREIIRNNPLNSLRSPRAKNAFIATWLVITNHMLESQCRTFALHYPQFIESKSCD